MRTPFGWLFGVVLAASQPVRAEPRTLEEAIRTALDTRPAIAAERATIRAAEAGVAEAEAAYYPRFDAAASATHGLGGSYGQLQVSGLAASPFKEVFATGLNGAWTVWDFGRTSHRVSQARAAVDRAETGAREVSWAVAGEVAHRYAACVAGRAHLVAAEGLLAARAESVAQARALRDAELGTSVDVGLAEVADLRAHREVDALRAAIDGCHAWLTRAVGKPTTTVLATGEAAEALPAALPDLESVVAEALTRRPDLAVLQSEKALALAQADAATGPLLPAIRVAASAGYAVLPTGPTDPRSYYAVGLAVEIPIFDGGQATAEKRRHEARAAEVEARLAEGMLEVRAQLEAARADIAAASAWLPAARREADQVGRVLEEARQRFGAGVGTLVEVAQAEASLASAREAVLLAAARLEEARVRFELARGGLGVAR